MKAIHFGAGNIGRGLIGKVLHDNGFEITFVDTNESLINQLKNDRGYLIELMDEKKSTDYVKNVFALNALSEVNKVIESLITCDIITTSIGADNLRHIASTLKKGLLERAKINQTINILANENMINASDLLKEEIKNICRPGEWESINDIAYFVNTAIDRQALNKNDMGKQIALVEPYYEWVIDQTALDPSTSYELSHVKIVTEMTPFIERKLFLVNAEHAAFAYLGALFNYTTIQEAINDSKINQLVRHYMNENIRYFTMQYELDEKELLEFVEKTIMRHSNSVVSDEISRVGRSPIRKLGPKERLIAPIKKLEAINNMNEVGKRVVVAAYLYKNDTDEEAIELNNLIRDVGIYKAIKETSQVSTKLAQEISIIYNEVVEDVNRIFI